MARKRSPSFHVRAITIVCTDRWKTGAFHEKVLGAVPIPKEEATCLWYRLGSFELTMVPNADKPSPAFLG